MEKLYCWIHHLFATHCPCYGIEDDSEQMGELKEHKIKNWVDARL